MLSLRSALVLRFVFHSLPFAPAFGFCSRACAIDGRNRFGRVLPFTTGFPSQLSPEFDSKENAGDLLETDKNAECQVELWLDLRGTAMKSEVALALLKDEIFRQLRKEEADERLVDRILCADTGMSTGIEMSDPDILVVETEDSTKGHAKVRRERDTSDSQRTEFGKVFSSQETETQSSTGVVDPIMALECVSSGGWAIIDFSNIRDQNFREEAVAGIVELLAAVSSLSAIPEFGSERNKAALLCGCETLESEKQGGVAIVCNTKADVLHSGGLIQELNRRQKGISLKATAGGILVAESTSSSTKESGIPFRGLALVLPFDPVLWQVALFVLGILEPEN